MIVPSLEEFSTVFCDPIESKASADSMKQKYMLLFLEFSCFFDDLVDAGNLISGSYAFSKSRLFMWKFLVHIMVGITNLKRRGTTRERGLSSK